MSKAENTVDVYERLANALEALPSGFPRTKSGVEMKLIKMAFTSEEVALAGLLSRFPETAAEIAERSGGDVGDVTALLESLIPRRLVRLDSLGMSGPGLPPQTPLGETVLDREEADKLLRDMEELGQVHLAFYGFTMGAESPQFVGTCNCCSCCCGILHGQKISCVAEGAQRSNYRAVIDQEECVFCGECIDRCPVDAISENELGKSVVTRDKCIGCGVCVIGCLTEAIVLEPVSEDEWFYTPSSMAEWEERRLEFLAEQN